MARLLMRRGPSPGTIYPLNGDRVNIGRGSRNDIIIRDNEVSREHCRLVATAGRYELLDLNSSNGTYVNGQPATRALPLSHGALIELGDSVTLVFEGEQPAAAPLSGGSIDPARPEAYAQPGQYTLHMTAGPEPGRSFELTRPIVNVGRDLSNDIVIQDPEVSRFHARLRRDSAVYTIEDLGSTNGTTVNGVEISEPTTLHHDAVICIGTSVRLNVASDVKAAPTADSPAPLRKLPHELTAFYEDTASGPLEDAPRHTRGQPAPESLRDHILLVYAREDWNRFVGTLAQNLRDARLKVWVDQDLTYGDAAWRAAMEQALRECWLMVVILSPRSLHLNHIRLCYRTFLNLKKPVIPIAYEPTVTLPLELARHHIIFHDRKHPHRGIQKLILEIKDLHRQGNP